MNNQKISMIMPNLNGEKYIIKAINSFLMQDYPYKELIIVDGLSNDSSHEIIQKFIAKNDSIIWIKEKDKGLADAINLGLNYCTGDIIGYLGSDDILYGQIFNEVANNSMLIDFDAIYFNSYTYYINEKRCIFRKPPNVEFNNANILKFGTIVGLQNILFKKHIFEEFRFNADNKYSMDYALYLDIVNSKKRDYLFFYVDKTMSINIFDNNYSYIKEKEQFLEAFNIGIKYCKSLSDLENLMAIFPIEDKERILNLKKKLNNVG